MLRRALDLPLLVILTGLAALMMLVPMAHAVRIADFFTARVFLQSALLFLLITGLIAIASVNYAPRLTARSHLIALLAAFLVLPLILAFPVWYLVPNTTYAQLYFEMVSCLTTTGATFFEDPSRLSEPVHLWRGFVGWMGGLLILVSAVSIFAPLNLGGFEVYAARADNQRAGGMSRFRAADMSERLISFTLQIAPLYALATALLVLVLIIGGERAFVAVMLAFSTLSTSGITDGSGLGGDGAGFFGEVMIFAFLLLAVSRLFFVQDGQTANWRMIWADHEFRIMLLIVTILPALMFLRHWIGAFEVNEEENLTNGLRALWGGIFTTLSFLTTTGFESNYWSASQDWSGLSTPGLMFLGVAVAGGGVATTAGGVKLLRVYALTRHGMREMQKLSFPSSVGNTHGHGGRQIRREGAYIAWLFFMLFAISTAITMLALTLFGLGFQESLVMATAALSTTGPLVDIVDGAGGTYAALENGPRAILALAMVLGRLEILAIVALFNPEFWRQ